MLVEMTITGESILPPPLSKTNPKEMPGFPGSCSGLKMSKEGEGFPPRVEEPDSVPKEEREEPESLMELDTDAPD